MHKWLKRPSGSITLVKNNVCECSENLSPGSKDDCIEQVSSFNAAQMLQLQLINIARHGFISRDTSFSGIILGDTDAC